MASPKTQTPYQVIARKYRPQRFEDVVGQEHVTTTLAHAIEQKRIAHAYIFCGPRGTGKTTIARIFAKCLNCTDGPRVDFSDEDPRCQEIAEGRSLDVLEIDGASNNSVDQVRDLRETCQYAPAAARFKIYIIDEVHMLTTAAFNALLKTLEEPPGHVKFLFATTDPEKVLPTILSRCQRFDLRRIPADLIAKHLAQVAQAEKVKIDPAALYAIARGAEGAMRDAQSTLDQLISFCEGHIQEADVLSMFGLAAQQQIVEVGRAVLAGEVEHALRELNDLAGHGKDLGRLLSDLLNHFRNLLIFQVSRGDPALLEVSETERAALGAQSKMATAAGVSRIMEVLAEAELRLRDATSKKILVEVALLKSIEARNAVSLQSVLEQLKNLRDHSGGAVVSLPMPASTSPAPAQDPRPFRAQHQSAAESLSASTPVSAEFRETASEPENSTSGDPELLWSNLLAAIGRASPFTRSYLLEAHLVSFDRKLLTIGFDPQFEDHLSLVDNPRNHTLLQTKLSELGHPNVQIKFVKAEAPAAQPQPPVRPSPQAPVVPPAAPSRGPVRAARPAPAPAPAARDKPASVPFQKDQFKNDPLIQKALEIFKGRIVDVRA